MPRTNTKETILDVAQDLMQRRGFNAVSYHDVCEVVGIRKASMFHHFPNKDELVTALLRRYGQRVGDAIADAVQDGDPASTQLLAYAKLYYDILSGSDNARACLGGMLGADWATLPAAAQDDLKQFYNAQIAVIRGILEDGIAVGEFRPTDDPHATAAAIFSTLQGAMFVARSNAFAYPRTIQQLVKSLS